jgi:hypothetical protein
MFKSEKTNMPIRAQARKIVNRMDIKFTRAKENLAKKLEKRNDRKYARIHILKSEGVPIESLEMW